MTSCNLYTELRKYQDIALNLSLLGHGTARREYARHSHFQFGAQKMNANMIMDTNVLLARYIYYA